MCEKYVKKLIFQKEVQVLHASMFYIYIFVEITFDIITAHL